MINMGLKITTLLLASALIAPSLQAMEVTANPLTNDQVQHISATTTLAELGFNSSTSCAMDLMPGAKTIYQAVSPKVEGDSNLRKLVKKAVKPKVFSGKLSIKSARKNAQEASVCLNLLKLESHSSQ